MSKNIGGSILPSSSPQILTPLDFNGGILIVIPDEAADTHRLEFHKGDNKTILASHPNGYSCHALAERMVAGDWQRVLDQAEYIVRCGGKSDISKIEQTFLKP